MAVKSLGKREDVKEKEKLVRDIFDKLTMVGKKKQGALSIFHLFHTRRILPKGAQAPS